jgi:hypothetical protein
LVTLKVPKCETGVRQVGLKNTDSDWSRTAFCLKYGVHTSILRYSHQYNLAVFFLISFLWLNTTHRLERAKTGDGHFLAYIQSWWYIRPSLLRGRVLAHALHSIYPFHSSYIASSTRLLSATTCHYLLLAEKEGIESCLYIYVFVDPPFLSVIAGL